MGFLLAMTLLVATTSEDCYATIEEVGEGSCVAQGFQSITSSEDCKVATRKIHGKNKWITDKFRRALHRHFL